MYDYKWLEFDRNGFRITALLDYDGATCFRSDFEEMYPGWHGVPFDTRMMDIGDSHPRDELEGWEAEIENSIEEIGHYSERATLADPGSLDELLGAALEYADNHNDGKPNVRAFEAEGYRWWVNMDQHYPKYNSTKDEREALERWAADIAGMLENNWFGIQVESLGTDGDPDGVYEEAVWGFYFEDGVPSEEEIYQEAEDSIGFPDLPRQTALF